MKRTGQDGPASNVSAAAPADALAGHSFTRDFELRLANTRLAKNDEQILAFLREHGTD